MVDSNSSIEAMVADELDCNIEDVSQYDYERLQDSFEGAAQSCIQDDAMLAKLSAAGFPEVATQLRELDRMNQLFDWAKENL